MSGASVCPARAPGGWAALYVRPPGMLIGGGVAAAIEACDLLDDLEDVLGYERVKLRDAMGCAPIL